jgi:hypothetical protein
LRSDRRSLPSGPIFHGVRASPSGPDGEEAVVERADAPGGEAVEAAYLFHHVVARSLNL